METTLTKVITDKGQILRIIDIVIECFKTRDLETMLSVHSDDIVIMEPDRPAIVGKAQVRKLFAAALEGLKAKNIRFELSAKIFELEIWENRAFVRGQVVREVTYPDGRYEEEAGKFISIFRKQNDGVWLRSHVMANFDSPKLHTEPELFFKD